MEACALGMLCKVGFSMFLDAETKWTKEEIDEISMPGFSDALIKVGLAKEANGYIEMPSVTPEFNKDMYNQMNAARMRERRRKTQKSENGDACNMCEQSATESQDCATVCNNVQHECNNVQHECNGESDNVQLSAQKCVKNNNRIDENNNIGKSTRASAQVRPIPEDAEEVFVFLKNQPHCGLTEEEARQCASTFYLQQEAIGWVGPRGAALRDWKKLALAFFGNWQNNKRNTYTNSPRKTKPVIDPREGLFDDPDRF